MTDQQQPEPPAPAAPSPKPKRAKPESRSARWTRSASEALQAINEILTHVDTLDNAISELRSVQEEYEEWKDNQPENLSSSPLGQKLEEVCGLEIESIADNVRSAVEEAQGTLEEAEGIDLPQGFGRD